MTAYVFDVDGTLTPSRQQIDPDFRDWFLRFQDTHETYIVSGSDYDKSLEQLGPEILAKAKMVFPCCGNEVRIGKLITYQSDWKPSIELLSELSSLLEQSRYPVKTGNHVEIRTGLVNFSVVGRNANLREREEYKDYDRLSGERDSISLRLQAKFPDLDIAIAGETGIDIMPRGANKAQILKHFVTRPIIFFGDKTRPGGNDFPLACVSDLTHGVEDWTHTWEILKGITSSS